LLEKARQAFDQLKAYCEQQDLVGWDPYDGLNSNILQGIPVLRNSSYFRLMWIQGFKRSPVNLRKIFRIEKGMNPKGTGLFLSGYCNLYRMDPSEAVLVKIRKLADQLVDLQSPGYSGACWGYNFDWQARAFFQPKYTPTVVATSFIGHALLDAWEILKDDALLTTIRSSASFILNDLNRTYDTEGDFCFSYSPMDNTTVFNASLLGSKILGRIYSCTKQEELLEPARKSVNYCIKWQKEDGSWYYSRLPYHNWIDSFHTGYNLEALAGYMQYTGDTVFKSNLDKGLDYYLTNFFTPDGIPKYYNNSVYPVDIHTVSQLILTLSKSGLLKQHLGLVDKVLEWTFSNMQDQKGYFYYQKKKFYTIKIPYMRWTQAWMFYALSEYLKSNSKR
jgi:rhamnogalacturonyl hydrolase YesR